MALIVDVKRICVLMVLVFFCHTLLKVLGDSEKKVLWVPFQGTVELGLAPYILRSLKFAEENRFDAVVLDIDTFGGRVDAAVIIRDALLVSPLTTVAWVNKRAISAGALVSLSCKKIFFTSASTMGAATPIQVSAGGEAQSVSDKVTSYFRAEMGATAEKNGRDRRIAESMVKAPGDIKDLIKKDDVLTLTDKSALDTKISDGTIDSQLELIKALGLQGAVISQFEINWAEQFVRFLTDPTISSFLMSGGVLGLLLEMKTPGFGFAGILSILCFALFFFGKFLVHLAGWEEVLLLLAGAALVAVEVFLLPGKIIPLVSGLILMVVALALAGVPKQIPFDMDFPDLHSHMNSVGLAFVVMMVGLVLIYYWISRHPIHSPLVMDGTSAAVRSHIDPGQPPLPGATGVAVSDLRPSGRVELDGLVFEAITEHGQYIQASEKIEVVEVSGFQVVVRQRTA